MMNFSTGYGALIDEIVLHVGRAVVQTKIKRPALGGREPDA